MKNTNFNYSDFILVHINESGDPLYNGHLSLYAALSQVYPNFSSLKDGKRMQILAEATLALATAPLELLSVDLAAAFPPKAFWYECVYNDDGTAWGRILEAETGKEFIIVDESVISSLEDEFDVEGLRMYLVTVGELLPYDTLKLIGPRNPTA